jgi:glycosyltransferase involved in cell wall biosynthesis
MKIALLTELFHPRIAGCERRFFEIGRRLSKRGHEVHVFTLRYDHRLPKEELIEDMYVHRYADSNNYISPSGFRSFSGVVKYSLGSLQKLLGRDFDIYYCNQWPMFHSVFIKPIATPLVQEWCEVWSSPKMAMLQKVLKLVSDYHVAVSDFTRRRLAEFLQVTPQKVTVIPNGVDFEAFATGDEERKWGQIIYVGRLVPHKNIDLLIEAFRIVKNNVPEAELHIIGSGRSLQVLTKSASDVDRCFIHGFVPDDQMRQMLRSSWLSVSLSQREGSGISCLEAMSSGVPVITADFPDNAAKELVLKSGGGLVVQPKSSAVASAILDALGSETSWKLMSMKAQAFASRHDWEIVTDSMEHQMNYWVS